MRARSFLGMKLCWPRQRPGAARPGQWVGGREKRWIIVLPHAYLMVVWTPYRGVTPVALSSSLTNDVSEMQFFPEVRSKKMKKLSIGGDEKTPIPAMAAESKIFKNFPRLLEFWTATTYEDGSPRAPGKHWFDQDGVGYTLTLFEPSGYAKMRLRAAVIDDTYTLAEKALGSENPPWEVDQYARDKAAGKKKK